MLNDWRYFWQDFFKPRFLMLEGALLPTASFLVQSCSRTINQSGERKVVYENENFTYKKFIMPVAFATRLASECACPRLCMLCAFADSASGLSTRLRYLQREHLPR